MSARQIASSGVRRSAFPAEIASGVWRVGGGSWNGYVAPLSAEADANAYFLELDGAGVLVDCGTDRGYDAIETNLRDICSDSTRLTDLVLTHSHWDHCGAAARWQARVPSLRTHLNAVGHAFVARGDHRLTGYQLLEPPHDFKPFRVDHAVADTESFDLGRTRLTAYHLPGHTPDSTLYTIRRDGLTIGACGDVVFAPRPDRGPVLGQLCTLWLSDLDAYVDSLQRMAAWPVDLLLPGHGPPVRGRDRVEDAVEAALSLAQALADDPCVRENVGV